MQTNSFSGIPGLMIAAPRSGAGKTTVTLGLMAALAARGHTVQPFKCGPDYIDPPFHAAATGRASFNLDGWCMARTQLQAIVAARSSGAGLSIAEGLMGLFDGVQEPGAFSAGASADIAALFGWPVILVLDVSGQSQTAGAVALGHARFRDNVAIAGVILNRTGSDRHSRLAAAGVEAAGLEVLGALPRNESHGLKERHLGLVQAGETAGLQQQLERLGAFVSEHCDLPRILSLASSAAMPAIAAQSGLLPPPGQRIALARDEAFSFLYPHILAGWLGQGAEILPFSPLADEAPDPSCDAVWLPGGYPELHAGRLAGNSRFMAGLRHAAAKMPVHGECGGFMVLGESLADAAGTVHPMAGLLGLSTSYAARRLHLGYRRAEMLQDCVLGQRGTVVRGHEFHYSAVLAARDAPLAAITSADGLKVAETGLVRGRVTGSFFHTVAVS